MNKGYQTRIEKGTQYQLTQEDRKRGFQVTAQRYPEKLPGILAKINGTKRYNGWDHWEGNKPK